MKKYFSFLVFISLFGCNEDFNNNNPYLPNVNFSINIYTNLPDNNSLRFVNNPKIIYGAGVQGIIVMRTGLGDSYVAYDASCPNQYPTTCSRLTTSGITASCSCDAFSYNLSTGQGGQQYPLKPYRVEVVGSVIRVYN